MYLSIRFAQWCVPLLNIIHTTVFDLHNDVCHFKPENIHTHIIHDRLMIDDVCHCIIYALLDVSFYQICTMMCAIVKHYTYTSVRFAQWCVPFQARPPPDSDLQHLLTFARLLAKVGHDSFFLPWNLCLQQKLHFCNKTYIFATRPTLWNKG